MFINDIQKSRKKRLVPADKFDRHMKRARANDLASRKRIFSLQSEVNESRQEARNSLKSSIY